MPEAMPANHWQAEPSATGLQRSTEKIFRIEWRAVAASEYESLRIRTRENTSLCQECLAYRPAHRHVSATALRLRAPKTSFVDGLAYVDRAGYEIDMPPAKREQFADPQSGQHRDHHKCSTRLGKGIEQRRELCGQQVSSLLNRCTIAQTYATSGIRIAMSLLLSSLQALRNPSGHWHSRSHGNANSMTASVSKETEARFLPLLTYSVLEGKFVSLGHENNFVRCSARSGEMLSPCVPYYCAALFACGRERQLSRLLVVEGGSAPTNFLGG